MLIHLINPNTTKSMTDLALEAAKSVVSENTKVVGVTNSTGPASIESNYDEALSVPGLLKAIIEGNNAGAEGFVISCFGDPGLDAAREIANGPVVAIAEAAMHTATYLSRSFSIITTMDRTIGRSVELVHKYGFTNHCYGVHAVEIPVLELENDDTYVKVLDSCKTALIKDKSEALILGCAGMADLALKLSKSLGVPVIDGVAAATLTVQNLITLNYPKIIKGEYSKPFPKKYIGLLSDFEIK